MNREQQEIDRYIREGFDQTESYLAKIVHEIKSPCDDIYIMRGASGETYLLLHAFERICSKMGSKNPVLIATAPYHVDLCKIYCPAVPVFFVPLWKIGFEKEVIKYYKGKRIFILFPFDHYIKWEEDLRKGTALHYYDNLLHPFSLSREDIPWSEGSIPAEIQQRAQEKARQVGLNLSKFVFILPEARSNPSLSEWFWRQLDDELRNRGYDTLFNCHDTKRRGLRHINQLSIPEAHALARLSKGIIGIKSGMIEPMLAIPGIPVISIFTSMHSRFYGYLKPMPVEDHMRGCTTMLLPGNTEHRFEYDGEHMTEEALLENIVEKFAPSSVAKGHKAQPYYLRTLQDYNSIICDLCHEDEYNLVAYKHLGDIYYQILTKKAFEQQKGKKLHIITSPKYEFLFEMMGEDNYSLLDIATLIENNDAFAHDFWRQFPTATRDRSGLLNEVHKQLFSMHPVLGQPFVCESDVREFLSWPRYWCYRWANNMGLNTNFRFTCPNKISLSEEAAQKISKIAPLNRIILIAPEATTAIEIEPEFWSIISNEAHRQGYKIIVNSNRIPVNHAISAIDLGLSLRDVVALGMSCAYTFSLRSGFSDALASAGNRLYVIYPAMLRREVGSLTKVFEQPTQICEISFFNWETTPVIWEGVDLTARMQSVIDRIHKLHDEHKRKYRSLFTPKAKKGHHHFWYNVFNDVAGVSRKFPENNYESICPKHIHSIIKYAGIVLFKEKYYPENNIVKRSYLESLVHTVRKEDYIRVHIFGLRVYLRDKQTKKILFYSSEKRVKPVPQNETCGIKEIKEKCIRIAGFPVYSRKYEIDKKAIKYSYLGGLVHTVRKGKNKRVHALGLQVYARVGLERKLLFFSWIPRKGWLAALDAQIDPQYDDIYLFRYNFGESYVELMHLAERIRVHGSKKPLVVVRNERYLNFFRMYLPEGVDCKLIPLDHKSLSDAFNAKGHSVMEVVQPYKGRRFICSSPWLIENLKRALPREPQVNFYTYLMCGMGVAEVAQPTQPRISAELQERAAQTAKALELGDKYIILAPEATSLKMLEPGFWSSIITELRARGYKILINSASPDWGASCAHAFLDAAELFVLAQGARGIISMGSGLAVFLSGTGAPMDLIYTDFNGKRCPYTSTFVKQVYSVHHLPGVKPQQVREYDMAEISLEEVSQTILSRYV